MVSEEARKPRAPPVPPMTKLPNARFHLEKPFFAPAAPPPQTLSFASGRMRAARDHQDPTPRTRRRNTGAAYRHFKETVPATAREQQSSRSVPASQPATAREHSEERHHKNAVAGSTPATLEEVLVAVLNHKGVHILPKPLPSPRLARQGKAVITMEGHPQVDPQQRESHYATPRRDQGAACLAQQPNHHSRIFKVPFEASVTRGVAERLKEQATPGVPVKGHGTLESRLAECGVRLSEEEYRVLQAHATSDRRLQQISHEEFVELMGSLGLRRERAAGRVPATGRRGEEFKGKKMHELLRPARTETDIEVQDDGQRFQRYQNRLERIRSNRDEAQARALQINNSDCEVYHAGRAFPVGTKPARPVGVAHEQHIHINDAERNRESQIEKRDRLKAEHYGENKQRYDRYTMGQEERAAQRDEANVEKRREARCQFEERCAQDLSGRHKARRPAPEGRQGPSSENKKEFLAVLHCQAAQKRDREAAEHVHRKAAEEEHIQGAKARFFNMETPEEASPPFDYNTLPSLGNQFLSPRKLRQSLADQMEADSQRKLNEKLQSLAEEEAHIIGLEDSFFHRPDRRRSKPDCRWPSTPSARDNLFSSHQIASTPSTQGGTGTASRGSLAH